MKNSDSISLLAKVFSVVYQGFLGEYSLQANMAIGFFVKFSA